MAAPKIINVFPSNESESVPVGAKIAITFDRSVDLNSVKNNVVIFGGESEIMTGPNDTVWRSQSNIGDPNFLRTSGFKGLVEYDIEGFYVNSETGERLEVGELTSLTAEEYLSAHYKVELTPNKLLAELNNYKVYIVGEVEDNLKKGITKRTVYDVDYSNANSSTGLIYLYGGYESGRDDKLHIEITEAGNIGTCEYDFWFEKSGKGSKVAGNISSRRYRKIKRNLQIRFSGSSFEKGDIYTVELYKAEFLEDSYTTSFKTSSSFIEEVPDTMATSPIGTKLLQTGIQGGLELLNMSPEDGGTNLLFDEKTIVLTFGNNIDESTVTDDTVVVYTYPVSGTYGSTNEPRELRKKLTVEDNKIIIEM
jgi:hypothetical protein